MSEVRTRTQMLAPSARVRRRSAAVCGAPCDCGAGTRDDGGGTVLGVQQRLVDGGEDGLAGAAGEPAERVVDVGEAAVGVEHREADRARVEHLAERALALGDAASGLDPLVHVAHDEDDLVGAALAATELRRADLPPPPLVLDPEAHVHVPDLARLELAQRVAPGDQHRVVVGVHVVAETSAGAHVVDDPCAVSLSLPAMVSTRREPMS